jgi:acetyl esterase
MPLDPALQTLVKQAAAQIQVTPREPLAIVARERAAIERARSFLAPGPEPVASIEDFMIPGPAGDIPVRLYIPDGTGPFPVLLFFHGGWAWGDLDTHAPLCRPLCHGAGCLVLSVDYSLAPEHKFPAGLHDCYTATRWMVAHAQEFQGDPSCIAVGGDSGGGNFAAVTALMMRDQRHPSLLFQLLLWPMMDFRLNTPSWKDYDGYLIHSEEFLIFRDFYLPNMEEQLNPYVTPLLAPNLSGLPPALIITAECDPVRDGGEEYGRLLLQAGVPITVSRYDGMVHSFMYMRNLVPVQADQAFAEAIQALRTAFASDENRV